MQSPSSAPSVADHLAKAADDALVRCAYAFGIKQNVEKKQPNNPKTQPTTVETSSSGNGNGARKLTNRQLAAIFGLGKASGMTHVRTSPYYPQSKDKIERWHQSLKHECIRPKTPLDSDDEKRLAGEFVEYYNAVRLHSAIDYITPKDKREGREQEIFAG